jgi:phosphate transport system protein
MAGEHVNTPRASIQQGNQTVKHFQRELDTIKKMILSLGALVEQRVHRIKQAIEDRDVDLAKEIVHLDHEIDEMEVEIEEACLKIIALHQPVAADLRFLVAVIKINNDLERIGDQVVNIAQRVVRIAKRPVEPYHFDYSVMAEKAEAMLRMSLDSLVNQDLDQAIKVLHLDDEVDNIKDQAYDRIKQAMADGLTEDIGYMINLLLISRHLERLADHATNIAEEVVYMIEGEIVRHGRLD